MLSFERTSGVGGGGGAGGFNGQFHRAEEERHGLANLIIGYQNQFIDKVLAEAKAIGRGVRRTQAISDGLYAGNGLGGAGGKAAVHGICADRLDAKDLAGGLQLFDRGRHAGAQTATTNRNDHRVKISHLRGKL